MGYNYSYQGYKYNGPANRVVLLEVPAISL